MKIIYSLFTFVPAFALGFGQIAASSPMTVNRSESIAAEQPQAFLIANPFRVIRDTINTVDDASNIDSVNDAGEVINTIDRTIREENRRRELEEARKAATEQERLEAERRQQYFESLSPEEQQAYIEEQEARQAQRDQAALLFLMAIFASDTSSETDEGRPNWCNYDDDASACQ